LSAPTKQLEAIPFAEDWLVKNAPEDKSRAERLRGKTSPAIKATINQEYEGGWAAFMLPAMTIEAPSKPIVASANVAPRPQIPVDNAEAAALFLAEIMPPAVRRELGRLLVASG
jgi:hypothetical protein